MNAPAESKSALNLTQPIGWQSALLALLAWRYAVLFEELTLRPLYAWDAWMNWAPKAVVWFHQQVLVEFAHPHDWLQQEGEVLYTLGNRFSSDYPETVPLILLWSMLGGGTADHGAIYLPWVLVPPALGVALYGHLRLAVLSLHDPATPAGALELFERADAAEGGGLRSVQVLPAGANPKHLAAGDIDGDGQDELFAAAQNGHRVHLWSQVEGRLEERDPLGAHLGCLDVALADVDGDGRPEVLVANGFSDDVSLIRVLP